MKKVGTLCLVLLLLTSMMLPIQAISDNTQEIEVIHTRFGEYEVEVKTVIYASASRSSSRSADKLVSIKRDGKVIADVTLSATFGYDGKTAWISNPGSSHTTYSGWSYGSEKITKSGGTASLSATLSHLLYRNVPVNISLTCSPTGQIS